MILLITTPILQFTIFVIETLPPKFILLYKMRLIKLKKNFFDIMIQIYIYCFLGARLCFNAIEIIITPQIQSVKWIVFFHFRQAMRHGVVKWSGQVGKGQSKDRQPGSGTSPLHLHAVFHPAVLLLPVRKSQHTYIDSVCTECPTQRGSQEVLARWDMGFFSKYQ